jgi:hypothetical protein
MAEWSGRDSRRDEAAAWAGSGQIPVEEWLDGPRPQRTLSEAIVRLASAGLT